MAARGGFASAANFWPSGAVRSAAGGCFCWKCWIAATAAPPRVGFTVTKKTGNAVSRNRIRRRLKEAVRVHAAGDMAAGNDYVIVGREDVLAAPFGQIAAELSRRIRATR